MLGTNSWRTFPSTLDPALWKHRPLSVVAKIGKTRGLLLLGAKFRSDSYHSKVEVPCIVAKLLVLKVLRYGGDADWGEVPVA